MIDYDDFETWGHGFSRLIEDILGLEAVQSLMSSEFEFVEDAGDFIAQMAGVNTLSFEIRRWIVRNDFCVFHGTRLLPDEVLAIRTAGLKPLVASHREPRLRRLLSGHRDWRSHEAGLTEVIEQVGPGERAGRREGQVHFSLSRAGLVDGFDHYLAFGSEFDQRVTQVLFGDDIGLDLLRSNTSPFVVKVRLSGEELVAGAHPIFRYDDVVGMGEMPGLASTFLNTWAFKTSRPDFDIGKLRTDCCVELGRPIMPDEVLSLEELGGPG